MNDTADHAVNDLFQAGIFLHLALDGTLPPEAAANIADAIDRAEHAIRAVRSDAFNVRRGGALGPCADGFDPDVEAPYLDEHLLPEALQQQAAVGVRES